MPLIETKGAASAQGFGLTLGGAEPVYIEQIFSTYLYTGNGSTQTITNGIDLSGKGGLVWLKGRSAVGNNWTQDTDRGVNSVLYTNLTNAAGNPAGTAVSAFNTTGFSLGSNTNINNSGDTYVSWTFRKQPKFFDVVTYTGDGTNNRQIPHSLASVPGCVIVKRLNAVTDWLVWHRSSGAGFNAATLNGTGTFGSSGFGPSTAFTDTYFTVANQAETNASGGTYVAYLFAHNAGGFGLTGTDNVISCGSYTGNGSTSGPSITLGYEPQWVLIKNASAASSVGWFMTDNLRGCETNGTDRYLAANLSQAETDTAYIDFTATGFNINSTFADVNGSGNTMIYIAIRRGPMRTPTSGTSVFAPVAYTATNVDNRLVNTGIITDMTMARVRTALSTGGFYTADRLRGNPFLGTAVTNAEDNSDTDSFMTPTAGYGNSFSAMNGFGVGNDSVRQLNYLTADELAYAFRRAPGFFDEVCYTGTGATINQSHNLGVPPELIFFKSRSAATGWRVIGNIGVSAYDRLVLQTTAAATSDGYGSAKELVSQPTSSVLSIGTGSTLINSSGATYVAYLFATCAGVSKVGSYTGNGSTQTINCGFTGGARFVLIKRTDSTGDWYVWDTARGMVSGTDPSLLLNSTAAEVNANSIYTTTGGFQIVSTASSINASGGSYIYFSVA